MKVLNLYAGIGGNRKLWPCENVTAVEFNPQIAAVYRKFFPKDTVIVGDAHEYLKNHCSEYDFIWASPPCQSHSSFRQNICVRYRGTKPEYPDMRLYQEILFLRHNYNGFFVIENVKPYYTPLVKPDCILQRHLFWSNVTISEKIFRKDVIRRAQIPQLQEQHGFDLTGISVKNKRQVLRNCVYPEVGLHIWGCMVAQKNNMECDLKTANNTQSMPA